MVKKFNLVVEKFKYSNSKNIGGMIKKLAQIFMWIVTATYIIGGFILLIGGIIDLTSYSPDLAFAFIPGGIAAILLSFPLGYITYLWLYVIGELVENSAIIAGKVHLQPQYKMTSSVNSGKPEDVLDGLPRVQNFVRKTDENEKKKAELERLKEQGLITEEEYQAKIKRGE